jgi:prepilin-type processing-associated H-X9-DG protein
MNAKMQRLQKRDIVVLTLCTAVLFSTFGAVGEGGRRRAKEFVCQANLRQWGIIFQGYVTRNNGRFFSGDTPGYWWVKGLDQEHQDWKRMRIWFCPQAQEPIVDETGRIVPTLSVFNAWGIFRDVGPNGICGSYGVNGYLMNIPDKTVYEGSVPASQGWRDLTNVPGADTVPMFLEALRFDLWPLPTNAPAADEFAAWSGNHMGRCCINRHNGTVSCLFVDGSVRKVGLKELWTLKWHKSFNTAGPWTQAGGVLPTDWPEWMRQFKDY